jgi:hypothetical protein
VHRIFCIFTYYYYYYYVKQLYIATFITFFSQAVPLGMYVFYTNTHVMHWDLSPNHNCVIICFLGFQPDDEHIWPTHVANLNKMHVHFELNMWLCLTEFLMYLTLTVTL